MRRNVMVREWLAVIGLAVILGYVFIGTKLIRNLTDMPTLISYDSTAAVANAPAAPTKLNIDTSGGSLAKPQVDLWWKDNSNNESSFWVERSTDGGKTFTIIAKLPANTVRYTDYSVKKGGTYSYFVLAQGINGGGRASGTGIARVPSKKDILVIYTELPSGKKDGSSDTNKTISEKIDKLNKFYKTNSYGKWKDLNYDITSLIPIDYKIKLPVIKNNMTVAEVVAARKATVEIVHDIVTLASYGAAAKGFESNNYRYVFVVTAKFECLSVAGVCTDQEDLDPIFPITAESGKSVFINGNQDYKVYAHEFGHNILMIHFKLHNCGVVDYREHSGFDCNVVEYWKTMIGDAKEDLDLSVINRLGLGFLKKENISEITKTGIYKIEAIESNNFKLPKGLHITKDDLYVEYRGTAESKGRSWITKKGYEYDEYGLKTMVNYTGAAQIASEANKGGLTDGNKFIDDVNKVRIIQESHTATDATICVEFGNESCHPKPTTTPTPTPTKTSTPTPTPTPTDTYTPTPTDTYYPTYSPTFSPTPTSGWQ